MGRMGHSTWTVSYTHLCAVGTWLCARGSALVARAQEDDDAFEEADRLLCIATILSSAGFPWGIVAMGVAGPVLSTAASGSVLLGAFAVDVYKRQGGDYPRNVMASPLSGAECGEYFDVLPWAEKTAEYLLTLINCLLYTSKRAAEPKFRRPF